MIRTKIAHMRIAAASHAGMSGKNNEDNFGVAAFKVSETRPVPSVLAIVADGIGGHKAGEVASQMAVDIIGRVVSESDAEDPVAVLTRAIAEANYYIVSQAHENKSQAGMGATCVCAWVIGTRLYTASVGDSRLYWLRNGIIQQLTTDHTWVHEAIQRGILRPEDARTHPNAHIIRRYLGSDPAPEVDFRQRWLPDENDARALNEQGHRLLAGDRLLLCSDGLTDLVDDAEIAGIVFSANDMDAAVKALIDLANQRGGHDNITVVLLEMVGAAQTVPVPAEAPSFGQVEKILGGWPLWAFILGGLILLAVLGGLVFALLWAVGFSNFPFIPTPTPLL